MDSQNIKILSDLKSVFEFEEDWVAVGHVAYLLQRLYDREDMADARILNAPVSHTIH
ncbi:hypothetical protein [Erythrobacter sp.]|uniref:hypothetical protein n=1 Tax=Erythrobacter sp. TaxID=1042 RepID=UPI001425DBD8|nr:hypothetical protein [Erythrobacter sp.]QIQ87797.1 MAG: hypothetical protein G9473_14700 [Erythrobacter sp.]